MKGQKEFLGSYHRLKRVQGWKKKTERKGNKKSVAPSCPAAVDFNGIGV